MFDHDTNADGTVSRRSVLETTGGLIAGATALAGLGSERGAATPDRHGPLRADLRERNEEYIAVEVRFPKDTYDEIKPLNDVYLGDADQFLVHDDEDAVSLPEAPERLATPVEMEHLYSDEYYHGKLMYFRTGDVDWPKEYDGVEVTLGVGAFPERTAPGDHWDTCPGLRIHVRDMTEDYVGIEMKPPDGVGLDDVDFADEVFLGHAEQFVIHEEEDAVSLPEATDDLATPVEMDFRNPHDVVLYFRTQDSKVADFIGQDYIEVGIVVFTERTIPGTEWDADTVDTTCPECG
jgi:hypothetical protein